MKKLIKVLTEKENLLIAEIGAKLRFDIIVNYTINGIEKNRLCKCLMEDAVTKDWLAFIDVDEDEHIDKVKIDNVKPLLFPMSMLNESFTIDGEVYEKPLDILIEYLNHKGYGWIFSRKKFNMEFADNLWIYNLKDYECVPVCMMIDIITWLDFHHFDCRGLIDKGFAIPIQYKNNVYKERDFR